MYNFVYTLGYSELKFRKCAAYDKSPLENMQPLYRSPLENMQIDIETPSKNMQHDDNVKKKIGSRIDEVLAVWRGISGGTAEAIAYARKRGKPVVIIDPREI